MQLALWKLCFWLWWFRKWTWSRKDR